MGTNIVVKPPSPILGYEGLSIFLAGSIEMGVAEDWQIELQDLLKDHSLIIYNPRRDDWDSSWEQRSDNPPFREQVEWELAALNRADLILMYLQPGTKSPISLLELGLCAASRKLAICCPDGFWRKGNVDIVCQKFSIPQCDTLEELANFAIKKKTEWSEEWM
jgi:hypothetical protein